MYNSNQNINSKEVLKLKKIVQKRYPGAYTSHVGNKYTIVYEDDTLNLHDILAEMLFLPTASELEAWKLASTVSKTIQNINRTHPDRLDSVVSEEKILRMSRRQQRAMNTRKSKLD